ncbi:uncharacterized protein LOC105771791 [Gossypium raimondii]|uniref:uncharacterized protein LOC105771791 n=1 Tax=Gossypium raimondii TaxID=29730 RepID=UPI00063AD43D|nr:uncharacterized protein LOC105771791 [Gossypium raimondii]
MPRQSAQHGQSSDSSSSSIKALLKEYMDKTGVVIQSQVASLQALERALPSDIENSRAQGKEHCKIITLRSGTQLNEIVKDAMVEEGKSDCNNGKISETSENHTTFGIAKQSNVAEELDYLADGSVTGKQYVLKQLHISIPLVEALEKMSDYVKIMKDILSKTCRLREFEILALTKGYTVVLNDKLPPKLKDPKSFTIPCSIENQFIGKALCNLVANINLIPMSIFRKLGIGKGRLTTISLQLVDRFYADPKGKVEDVLVRVDKFIFPADFLVLECEVDHDVSIILGRPFLGTGRTLIDVQKGELTIRVNEQQITFNVFDALKYADENKE